MHKPLISYQICNHVLRILPRHMRVPVNDDVEGLPPRLNTSRDISNESIIDQPELLKPLPLRPEKRNRKNTGIHTFIFSAHDALFF